jgi:hypothetical protein
VTNPAFSDARNTDSGRSSDSLDPGSDRDFPSDFDRERLYREIRRVLKLSGRFAIFDVVLNGKVDA